MLGKHSPTQPLQEATDVIGVATTRQLALNPGDGALQHTPAARLSIAARLWKLRGLLLLVAAATGTAGYFGPTLLLGPVVAVIPVQRARLIQSVVATGRVETPHRVQIGSQITGVVTEVHAEEGQRVSLGALLVTLDSAELQASVEQAQGAVAQAEARLRQMVELTIPVARENLHSAQANVQNAQQAYDRATQLRSGGFETQVQVDNARRTLDVAQAVLRATQFQVASTAPGGTDYVVAETALRQGRASLLVALSRVEYTRIRAPADGVVIARDVERGRVAQPGQVLMTLSPAEATELVVQIDERNLRLIAVGQEALASADAYADQRFPAELMQLSPAVDPQRASIEARLRVASPPEYLRQDMTVSVDIAVAERPDALVLPLSALRDAAGGGASVLRVEDGRAVRRPVRIGLRGVRQVEILEGLVEGDRVLPSRTDIASGSRVRSAAP